MIFNKHTHALKQVGFAAALLVLVPLAQPGFAEGGRAGENVGTTTTPQVSTPRVSQPAPAPTPTPAPAPAPRQTAAPQTATPAQPAPRQATPRPRRVIVETAPSGLPPEGETRFETDEVIVRFQFSSTNAQRNQAIRGLGISHTGVRTFTLSGVTVHRYSLPPSLSVRAAITRLEESAAVVNAQPNYIYSLQQETASKLPQFGNAKVELTAAHARTTGANTRIAVIDTAVDAAHSEFASARISSFDTTDEGSNVDPHGTSVAGILAANGKLTGVAPDAEIISIAAFSTDSAGNTHGNTWTIMEALNIAAEQGVHILNMSFSGPPDPLFERAMTGAQRENILPVAAAGNEGPDAATLYPAGYDTVLSVTAIDSDSAVYTEANTGEHIDFAAPGVDLLVLGQTSGFRTSSGTSMATAYVSGIASLILSANPGADGATVRSLLENSAADLGEPGKDGVYGHGLPNAATAINGLLN